MHYLTFTDELIREEIHHKGTKTQRHKTYKDVFSLRSLRVFVPLWLGLTRTFNPRPFRFTGPDLSNRNPACLVTQSYAAETLE